MTKKGLGWNLRQVFEIKIYCKNFLKTKFYFISNIY